MSNTATTLSILGKYNSTKKNGELLRDANNSSQGFCHIPDKDWQRIQRSPGIFDRDDWSSPEKLEKIIDCIAGRPRVP